jgi:ribosomal-protein-alanine N-acetyltransferase
MNTVPRLHTARTVMTVPSPDCAPQLAAWRRANRAHLAPWEPERTDAWFSEEAARVRLEQALDEAHAGSALHFIALDRIDMAIVAGCSFTNIVRGVFQACHLPASDRSAALLQRLGFEREGLARSYLRIAGQWQDMVLTSLINPH